MHSSLATRFPLSKSPRTAFTSAKQLRQACRAPSYPCSTVKPAAQFIAICRSAKTCEIGENLLSVADSISRLQERLNHVGACVRPPTLQRRPVSDLHSYAAMARSATPVSPVPEPGRRSLGAVPLPPRLHTLLVSRLQAHLQ